MDPGAVNEDLHPEGLSYPAEDAVYEIEVAEFLTTLEPLGRKVILESLSGMSAKDQWELIQSFYLED
jgi:hypothetical protein